MKKIKLLAAYTLATLTLVSCSNNASLSNDLNSAGDSIVRFVNGTFYAELYNTSLQSVYNATLLALNNSNIYSVKNNTINSQDAEITGTYATDKNFFNKSGQDDFAIRLVKGNQNTVNLFIKIGKLGDKQASVDLLANIQTNLGI
ncbi:DUF3568 family protein [Francisella hispaniensis]|uniref:DUF3568 family protein n=1 Tax=Francisella hispaniensis TaxID=622488 RepID=UPI001906B92E|nr:DUF3568 family protein [Francisella hispaniensis]MBK2356261.1 DUF3568 domain-containing protein [Francisella hispaniensis]